MLEPANRDLTLYFGGGFDINFALYADSRVKRWRGEWHELFVYEEGEAVELEPGEAFVALLRSMQVKPGSEDAAGFWSPLEAMSLKGYTVELVCEAVFTLTEGAGLSIEAEAGVINIEVAPAQFADAPSSAHYYLKLTDEGGNVTFPINGTMLFKQP
jgi:hypothetical protein